MEAMCAGLHLSFERFASPFSRGARLHVESQHVACVMQRGEIVGAELPPGWSAGGCAGSWQLRRRLPHRWQYEEVAAPIRSALAVGAAANQWPGMLARYGLELLPSDAAPVAHGLGPVSLGRLDGAGRALRHVRLGRRGDLRGDGDRARAARLFRARASTGRASGSRSAAAVLFALALVLWWVLVYPVNVELAKWVNGPVPADWTDYRARWEWGHAIIALSSLLGFAALVASVLADTPRNFALKSALTYGSRACRRRAPLP